MSAKSDSKSDVVVKLPIGSLRDFSGHPYKVRDDESMRETAESVKTFGVLVPIIVRPCDGGRYEIISGHRRKRACELAGIALPANTEPKLLLLSHGIQLPGNTGV